MIAASEIGPDGEVRFNRPPADQRFIEPYSGLYFQISGAGADTFPSRSLWDRRLRVADAHNDVKPHLYDSDEFSTRTAEPLRIAERDAILPGSKVRWRFQVAQSRETIDDQIRELRSTLIWSFAALGVGLARPGRAADLLRPVAAAPGAPRGRLDPVGREDPHRPGFPDRNPPADRRDQPAARAQRGAGRGSAAPRRQPRPCAEDAADRDHQRRDRPRARPRRHRLPRGAGDAPPGRPPPRPRPGDRPPRLGPGARDACGTASRRSSAPSTGSTRTSPSTSPATTRRRSGSSARTSTKCSATSSKMPPNMAAAGCS